MAVYLLKKIGQFRSVSDNGNVVKTYIFYGKEFHTIAVTRFSYADEDGMDGWTKIRKFKDKWLFKETMHFKVESFFTIQQMVNAFFSWNTKIQQNR